MWGLSLFLFMGALLAKPIASTFRVWDLTNVKTVDYLNILSITNINVYLFANKPIRILPLDTWISDTLRFSFDGWSRQRLTNCYSKGLKVSWFYSLSYFTKLIINKRVAFHWSSVEPNLVLPFLSLLNCISKVTLPYSNINSSVENIKTFKNINSYKWSLYENYPTYNINTTSIMYKTNVDKKSITIFNNIQPLLTSNEESEINPIESLYSNSEKADITCLLQTEVLTSNNFIYFGTHGYINAQNSLLSIPILMAYERSNEFTGNYFIKGPNFSRSLTAISFTLFQLYYNIFNKTKSFKFKKPYPNIINRLDSKFSAFTFKINRSLIFRQPPQYEVSPLLQILNNFIKYDYNR